MNKLFFAVGAISLFALEGFCLEPHAVGKKTSVTIQITSKCKSTSVSYECTKPIKFDAAQLSLWKKDPSVKDPNVKELFYYTGTPNSDFSAHEKLRNDFMEKVCPTNSGGYQLTFARQVFTCTESSGEQEIEFAWGAYEHWSIMCNAAGGAEVLKQIYPKAVWVQSPRMPHYYESESYSPEIKEALDQISEKMPDGCRKFNCPSECGM